MGGHPSYFKATQRQRGKLTFLTNSKNKLSLDGDFFHFYFRLRAVVSVGRRGGYLVDHILAFRNASEDRVVGRQWIIRMHDKKLRTIGVGSGIRHRHRSSLVASLVDRG